jgi:polyferredoxin
MLEAQQFVHRRHRIQWFLAPIVVLTIALGWRYPILGFTVPITMLAGMIGGIFAGRFVCGNVCPRGAFFDRVCGWSARGRELPAGLKGKTFRWALFAALMAFMAFNLSRDLGNWRHWGYVFWLMCTLTTAIGLVMVVFVHPRGWCAFCPMGTLQNALGGARSLIRIDAPRCRLCNKCQQACPMSIPIPQYGKEGIVRDRDCLHCRECIAACPFDVLSTTTDRRP